MRLWSTPDGFLLYPVPDHQKRFFKRLPDPPPEGSMDLGIVGRGEMVRILEFQDLCD